MRYTIRSRFLGAIALLLTIGLAPTAKTQTSDTLQALKDSLSPDQQSSILNNVLGKGDTSGKKTDKKLETPDTMLDSQKTNEAKQPIRRIKKVETYDGRILRQMDEDPELRAYDTVIIDLTPIELAGPDIYGNQNNPNGFNGGANANGVNGQGGLNGTGGNAGATGLNSIAGALGANGIPNANGGANGNPNGNGANVPRESNLPEQKPKTEDEKKKIEEFRKRILAGNPYQLNQPGRSRNPWNTGNPARRIDRVRSHKKTESRSSAQYRLRGEAHAAAPDAVRRGGTEAVWLRLVQGSAEHLCPGVGYSGAGRLYCRARRHLGNSALRQ